MTSQAEPSIHPTAIVDPRATLSPGVVIGPRCTIDGPVTLGEGVRLLGDVRIQGPATIGARTVVYPYACLGFEPQDRKFAPGSPTAGIVVGEDCIIRESFTVHSATNTERPTTLGNRLYAMVNSHVGHDSVLGDDITLVNGALVAGHVHIADRVTMSGATAIHQFARIGTLAFLSGGTVHTMDVPPFCVAAVRNRVQGINRIGMRRAGIDRSEITAVTEAFRRALTRTRTRAEMLEVMDDLARSSPAVGEMARFIRGSKRGICGGPGRPARGQASALRFGRPDERTPLDDLL